MIIEASAEGSARSVLAFYCSSRRGGNTDLLLDEFLRGCEDAGARAERIYVSDLTLSGCRACGGCDKTGRCVVEDGMQAVYESLERNRLVVLASPIYFYSVPAQAKAVIDRSQAFWARKYLVTEGAREKKPPVRKGFFLSVGATRGKRMFEGVCLTIRYFFDAIDASYEGELLYRGSDGKGDIRSHPTALKECYEAGVKFASV